MINLKKQQIDFNKMDGLVPAIVQDSLTSKVLMLGFMNKEAFDKTLEDKRVCFYSRTKQRLWTKGEESGNYLLVQEMLLDCDQDSILIKANPSGPVCHKGDDTCWKEINQSDHFIYELEKIVESRKDANPQNSYTASLFARGINKVAQKVGEEAVELVIEAKDDNDELFLNEAADLMYHYLVLLKYKGLALSDIDKKLKERHK
ncbi:bifunctional phosphoribosyl-AMP cyclohydrolase/phosphoribosyl-ATP diphosphatase HisIE [Portibacter marinus]|uniref:bifunctional phosphoribosyl-AMP cyclohydrolase/phosphoribosyl-ATP diphosphatase HisIE n=1 Tax=Portibacter marinus TaxID=2898660 RepID=UPI001F3B9617|nr:bifunctional phosphoribosyl-AMP cyclohydrolase/phosphoribosyl-ATP diphosphatase HisIE [Portibacter marinus]